MVNAAFRAWRTRMGFSFAEAGGALGVSENTVKAIEYGSRVVTARNLSAMERIEGDRRNAPATVTGSAIRIVGGGTFSHVRTHLSLAAHSRGTTAREIAGICRRLGRDAELVLTSMGDPASPYVTTADMARLVEDIAADPRAKIVFWNPAICDFDGAVGDVASAAKAARLQTRDGEQTLRLTASPKLVSAFRAERKDLFVVAFKATAGATPGEQYRQALRLMKGSHVNLVLANDVATRHNMVVAPEEARYFETADRMAALEGLVDIALARSTCTFTRSTVVPHPGVAWSSPLVSDSLRAVVDHCLRRGAYKPFDSERFGPVTVGHFAARGPGGKIVTSRRWSNFNDLAATGMVLIEPVGEDRVVAYGGKPSVGGQSQRIIFRDHPGVDNIVHFHCPLKPGHPDPVPLVPQWPRECGSHQCGQATSEGIADMGDGILAVMLENHGPNVVFSNAVPPERVVAFIERNFDLDGKTGGAVS